jgi:hypothetical protein
MRQGQLGRSRGGLAAPWLTAPATFASNKPLSRVVLCLVAGITAPKAAGRIWADLGDVIFTKTIEAQGNQVLEHYQTRERISAPCTSKHAFFMWVTRMATLPTAENDLRRQMPRVHRGFFLPGAAHRWPL